MTALGIDIGGTKLLACAVDSNGRIRASCERSTGRATGPARLLELLRSAVGEILPDENPTGIGIGVPGLVDRCSATVHSSVILPELGGLPLGAAAERVFGVRCVIDNDVNCAAVGEAHARGSVDSMLYVAVGTGIGGAIVIRGRLWRGDHGLAGEIGHMILRQDGATCICGGQGCLHVAASGSAVEDHLGIARGQLRRHVAGTATIDWAIVQRAACALGIGLASACNLLDISLVVVGGGVAQLGHPYLNAVREGFRSAALQEIRDRTHIEPARAGITAGAIGAALLARASPEA